MKRKPLFLAFSTQKGGVGKTTFTVLAASYLHYLKGYNVAVMDCDYPQYSINRMRDRDANLLDTNIALHEMAMEQFARIDKPTYPILCSSPEQSIASVNKILEQSEKEYDFVFFDLPGSVNNPDVLETLSQMDYIFTPIAADRISLESTLSFASVIKSVIVDSHDSFCKGIFLFWNMVDGREKTNLYEIYEGVISQLGIPILKTFVPNTTKYKKEGTEIGATVFRSTIFPASRTLLRGSHLVELMDEILSTINIECNGK